MNVNYDLDVRLTVWERLTGRLRDYGPLLPWRPCIERDCWNPIWLNGKCELCLERRRALDMVERQP